MLSVTIIRSLAVSGRQRLRPHRPIVTASSTVRGSDADTALRWTTKATLVLGGRDALPVCGWVPAITPSSVDFPEPLWPAMAVTRPAWIARETDRSARMPPWSTEMLSSSITVLP
jgi:hypothetical protein